MTLHVKFTKQDADGQVISTNPPFNSNVYISTNQRVDEQLAEAFQKIHNSFQQFQREGSGWTLDKILKLEMKIVAYSPITGNSYCPLPAKLKAKTAILNVQNDDDHCFKWSILAHLHPVTYTDHPYRVQQYKQYESQLDWSMISFPTSLSDIVKFEKCNNISVNVFGWENEIFPLQITKYRFPTHVNLLLITRGEKRHFCLIKNMSRLLGDRTKHRTRTWYCNYCLHGFVRQDLLDSHLPYCSINAPQKVVVPEEKDKWLKFKNHAKGLKVPFVIYADFECVLQPHCETTTCTEKYQKHVPSGFSYIVVSSVDKYTKPAVVYRGENVMDEFMKGLYDERQYITDILSTVIPMTLSAVEEGDFQRQPDCHICGKVLGADRVRDHDHLTGKYRGAAHNACNLNFRFSKENQRKADSFHIPIILHNLRGYDSHLIMESLGKVNSRLSCIANNMERYISFSSGNLRFIDSCQFMNSSLDKLVGNLAKDGLDKFKTLNSHYSHAQQLALLTRKGVYPYDYMDDKSKFLETQLPPPEAFYSILNDEHISESDYTHAQNIWRVFNIQTMGEYHDLYLKTDVLLLADVFENFRELCLQCYKLDPAHYYTAPGLAWEAMLRMTDVTLELLTDIDMYLMWERGIRGGISMISNKYGKANNKYLNNYDPAQPSKYITYLDANNLYGWAMSQPLPYGEFDWLLDEQITNFNVNDIPNESDVGYVLEVDLEYPTTLHNTHSDYPLAPENLTVNDDMLSPFSRRLKEELDIKGRASSKLVPNLQNKTKYIVHYKNLKFYLDQGMVLTKIHRALQFKQSCWLKSYIDFNTDMRKQAKSDFEKNFFKLMNNSVFGKTMENLRKRTNIQLVNSPKRMKKLCAKPSFKTFKIFNENLTAAHMAKTKLVLNRPIYVGCSILDISKILMYDFHYNFIKNRYNDGAKLLFTDTDSLCYEIETADIYSDMLNDRHLFDTSDYDRTHFLYSDDNKKVLGKMKDECAGSVVDEFVGLRSKMYSLSYGTKAKKTAKGVKRRVVDVKLKHDHYRECLFEHKREDCTMNQIRSFNHQLYSITVNKIGLSPFDDKRYVLENGCDTLALGHYQAQM